MTQRKPSGLSFVSWIDEQVADARQRGEFDALPGHGKPIPDLDHRDPDWWIRGLMEREGLDFLPETLRIRRDLERFVEELPTAPGEAEVLRRVREMNARIREANRANVGGPPSTVAPLEAERVVARWRKLRDRRG